MDFKNIAFFTILASIGAFWAQLKGFITKIFSIFIRTESIKNEWVGKHTFRYIIDNSKIIRWGNAEWTGQYNSYIKKYDKYFQFYYRKESIIICLYKNKIPIVLKKKEIGFSATYFYKTFNFRQILEMGYEATAKEASEMSEYQEKNKFYVTEIAGEDARSPQGTVYSAPTGQLGSPENDNSQYFFYDWLQIKADYISIEYDDIGRQYKQVKPTFYWSAESLKLMEEIKFWKENVSWFNDRGVVHKRGVLLHGKPGSGKSKMVLQVAETLQIPIKKLNLSNMSDEEFVKNYNVGSEKSMIILLEDLDVLFNLRENALAQTSKTKNLLSFDTLINTIAGIKRNDGIFLIITVNDISRCDPALIRPGRCDMKIEVGPLDRKGREFIARNILKGYPELIESIILTGEGKVAAEFENDCIELALREFYKDREKSLTLTA